MGDMGCEVGCIIAVIVFAGMLMGVIGTLVYLHTMGYL